jgi:hypothetical protein
LRAAHIKGKINAYRQNDIIWKMLGYKGGGEKKDNAIPVTGREGPYGYETSRLPHFL